MEKRRSCAADGLDMSSWIVCLQLDVFAPLT